MCGNRTGDVQMIVKNWKKDLFTIPNVLSMFRLLLIPVYIVVYLQATEAADYFVAAAILAVSCLTDLVDGMIARKFNMISTVGKFLDPLADKLTQFSLIVCLAIEYPVIRLLVALFVVKELFQLIAGIMTFRKGEMLTGALIAGKISTTVLFVSLILLVMMPNIGQTAVTIITIVDCVFLLISFISYARTYYKHSPMIQALDKTDETK